MGNNVDDLIAEIADNARKDRKRLEDVCNEFTKIETLLLDPEVAEVISKMSDSLSKINMQLLELVKLKAKKVEEEGPADELNENEKEDVFSKIGQGFD